MWTRLKPLFALPILLALGGCVGASLELGAVERPMDRPGDALPCGQSGLTRTVTIPPDYPYQVVAFDLIANPESMPRDRVLRVSFDVDETGELVNLRNAGPGWHTTHGATRQIMSAIADAMLQWRYEPESGRDWVFAYDCIAEFNFGYQLN